MIPTGRADGPPFLRSPRHRQLQSLQAEIASLKKTTSSSTSSSSMPVLPGDEAVLPPAAKLDALAAGGDPLVPSEERVLEALKRENEALRSKLYVLHSHIS